MNFLAPPTQRQSKASRANSRRAEKSMGASHVMVAASRAILSGVLTQGCV